MNLAGTARFALGPVAARSAALLGAVAVLGRASSFLGQLVLGWYLTPESFGLYGSALASTTILHVLVQGGLRETLLQRSGRLRLWGPFASRLSLSLALGGMSALLAFSLLVPFEETHRPLRWMLPLLALNWPLSAAGLVHEVRLHADLAFRAVSRITFSCQLFMLALQVVLARTGLGVLSLVIPLVASTALRTLLFRLAAGALPAARPVPLRRGLLLLGRSRWAVVVTLLGTVWAWGDYLLLGLRFAPEDVGQYYFAFSLSTAPMLVLTHNVSQVLTPTLLRLKGTPDAQWQATKRALSMLALVAFPVLAGMVLVGIPLLGMVYGTKWATASSIFAVLSVGMAFRVAGSPAGSLMQAQGRFRFQAGVMAKLAILFVCLMLIGLASGSFALTTALIAAFYVIVGPFNIWSAGRSLGGTLRDVAAIFARPTIYTAVGLVAALATDWLTNSSILGGMFARASAFSLAYLGCVALFSRAALEDLVHLLRGGSSRAS